jgi:hypothetical protein
MFVLVSHLEFKLCKKKCINHTYSFFPHQEGLDAALRKLYKDKTFLVGTEDHVCNSSRYTRMCHGTEGEEWKYEYMRVSGRSWKAHQ